MKFLIFLLFFAKLTATVDEQIQEWKEVYASFHQQGSDWKTTHVAELADRISHTANYVKDAVQHIPERSHQIETIRAMTIKRSEQHALTFQWAMRCFDTLTKICDQKISLEVLPEELPESYFDERFKNSRSFLRNADIYFLCVPKSMLKLERFVEGYLQEKPVQYVAIGNQELESGGHGNYYKTVYDVYYHDLQHAYYFFAIGGKYFKYFWPGYSAIKDIRTRLNSFEKNIVDGFLHTYFHEIYADAYKFYKSEDGSFVEPVGLNTNLDIFYDFIDRMEAANTRFDLRINFDAINWSRKDVSHYSKLISSALGCTYNDDTNYRLRNASSSLIENHLPSSSEDIIEISDVLEITHKMDSSIIEEIPCTVQIEDISRPLSTVHISSEGKTCSFQIYGPGHKAPHYFQDVLYLLKHARFIGERDVYKQVTIFNYATVRDLAIQMRADAVQILKDKFKRRPNSLSIKINDSLNISS